MPHTLEEAYEVADAAGRDDPAKLLDELGDLLFQTYFLALLLSEQGEGDLADVAEGITVKLIRRHPHVFGGTATPRRPARCGRSGSRSRPTRRAARASSTTSRAVLPGTLYARKVQRRASAVGFDWHAWDGAWGDLQDELRELREALDEAPERAAEHEPDAHVVHELGDLLFAAINVARLAGVDPELALRAAADRFRGRVDGAADLAAEAGVEFAALSLEEQDAWYRRAKARSGD